MNPVYEYIGNVHIHTSYSDGQAYHADLADLAGHAGLDFLITTDHNVWVGGVEGYYTSLSGQRVLLLVGEEVHDPRRSSPGNHMLIFGAERELSQYAPNPQVLIDQVKDSEGACFLAHPVEHDAPLFNQGQYPWTDWDIEGYTGLELWNYMSEFKTYLTGKWAALRNAFNPERIINGPFPKTLALWDKLLHEGKRVKVIGGSDAHGTWYSMGPVRRAVFPYDYLFRCVNTHIVTQHPLEGDFATDKQLVLAALRYGHAFVGYDLPASTRGFRFSAQGHHTTALMGDWIRLGHGVTLQMVSPQVADMRLMHGGEVVSQETGGTHHTYIATRPGAYRVEVYITYKGKQRGWIFSNPIFVV
jgi:hypothetical protein